MLWQLTASEAARQIRDGLITSEDLVTACHERIVDSEAGIGAWAHYDMEFALEQARDRDRARQRGLPLGDMHGVPVGIKDIIDTKDLPTECGSPILRGRQPDEDATVISKLREAGAVIMGKTVTTEFAFLAPSETANPHDAERSPGGSSSGSAAAVAAGHVPLAVGSQTNGSIIRPASFCGVFGFKPTRGMISRHGVLQTSTTLDQVGGFGRCLDDVAMLVDALSGFDGRDAGSYARPRPKVLDGARTEAPVEPAIAWFELPFNDRLDDDARQGFDELLEALGGTVERLPAPKSFAKLIDAQNLIHRWEMHQLLQPIIQGRKPPDISAEMLAALDRVNDDTQAQYDDAKSLMAAAEDYFVQFFHDYDAVIAPAAPGQAPLKTTGTGDPIFCTMWTLCGLPSLSVPWLTGADGLPIGVQLIGSSEADDRLCRTVKWLQNYLEQEPQGDTQ